jgi:uncharacterized protein GlcG (DUF336 family)
MKRNVLMAMSLALIGAVALGGATMTAQTSTNAPCKDLPSWSTLQTVLKGALVGGNGGLNLNMWGTLVNRDGVVCAVAFTGSDRGDQWPGSRVISAQKANTANAFSLPGLALSTANLFTATQPGGSLFGLQESNPVSTDAAYGGNPANYGQANDPMVGTRIGGINVFGGGLALYNSDGKLVGGLGVSGDTSCADHNIAWRTRKGLGLDYLKLAGAGGVSGDNDRRDNIIFDIYYQNGGDGQPGTGQMPGVSVSSAPTASGFGHPSCHGYNAEGNIFDSGLAAALPATN